MIELRPVTSSDAVLLRHLAQECPPLDVHTHYTYWVLAEFYGTTCRLALQDGEPVGFATAVVSGSRALLWQLGVLPAHRRQGVAGALLDQVSAAVAGHGAQHLEVSIAPDNEPSRRSFESLAARRETTMTRIGTVDLNDPEASFVEFEDRYAIGLVPD